MEPVDIDPGRFGHNGRIPPAYQDLGGAGGESLLLLSGGVNSRHCWPIGFVEALKDEGFHVLAFHPREAEASAEELTDDVIGVLDAMALPVVHLFGAWMGGLLVQSVALRHPERIVSIVSFATLPSEISALRLLKYLKIRPLFHLVMRKPKIAPMVGITAGLSPGAGWAVALISRPLRMGRNAKKMADIAIPVLVIHGTSDPILRPIAGRDIAKQIDGSRFLLIPQMGHELTQEVWALIADEVGKNADLVRRFEPAGSDVWLAASWLFGI